MSYLFFLLVGLLWGLGCGLCDARGILRNDRTIMQLVCAIPAYAISYVLFMGQPEGGFWLLHLIEVVTVSQLTHGWFRAWLRSRSM
jgi:hypothetical protein